MASLSDNILHTCVGAPTYFDCLPGDVLRFCIMPFLGWEDRIHLNMLTPPGDRTPPNKIPKDRIIAHQLYITTKEMTARIERIHGIGRTTQIKRTEGILNVLRQLNNGNNILLCQYASKFRNMLVNKIAEFSDPNTLRKITRVKQREEMKKLVNVLVEKMATHPFSHDIKLSYHITVME